MALGLPLARLAAALIGAGSGSAPKSGAPVGASPRRACFACSKRKPTSWSNAPQKPRALSVVADLLLAGFRITARFTSRVRLSVSLATLVPSS